MPYYNITFQPEEEQRGIYDHSIIDNTLTFENYISYGCVDHFNITGLRNYCNSQAWKKKLIYEIFNNFTHIARFGNPNIELLNDWIDIKKINLDQFTSNWDEYNLKCTIPSVVNVDIMYATYGLVNNTQYAIYDVQFRVDYMLWYYKSADTDTKNPFYSYVFVNYYKIPQDTVWYYAPAPGFIKFPRNIMYPFKVGTTQYGQTSSISWIKVNMFSLFLLILFLIFN
jgi:hypothetical protein